MAFTIFQSIAIAQPHHRLFRHTIGSSCHLSHNTAYPFIDTPIQSFGDGTGILVATLTAELKILSVAEEELPKRSPIC